ncbi:MAG: glucosidase [Verrucomicrobiota bacterium]
MSSESQESVIAENLKRDPDLWYQWGPYLAERQWGTVREDYSPRGDAWTYLPHDHARSRAYRWGEDGIAGISDVDQYLCMSLALWNFQDPILKERLFGLSGPEGNHAEDVKELYYYLDATPTHSYLKMLYKYPQQAFPYEALVQENKSLGYDAPEYELIDTGIFDDDRYFDVYIEYAKGNPEDILMRVSAINRGPEEAEVLLCPQVWFRNTWTFGILDEKPEISLKGDYAELNHPKLGTYYLYADKPGEWLFTENDTNVEKLFDVDTEATHFKDGFNEYIVNGNQGAVNTDSVGTKLGITFRLIAASGGTADARIRLSRKKLKQPFKTFDSVFKKSISEADSFYGAIEAEVTDEDERLVQRQAFAGLIWTKQFYYFDIYRWLKGDKGQVKPPQSRKKLRNNEWTHLYNADIISMPDKWEYPWFAAWDLAFHCLPIALIDSEFAKRQILLMVEDRYMHPNGQIPAYEWDFGDVNPPVHAWGAWRVFQIDRKQRGDSGDLKFLESVYHKLMVNFTWWVNRKDADGRNVFQGGFLGLDNIGVFDRSADELPTGGKINQVDGTSWMAMYCLNMMRMGLELAREKPVYQDIATKFFKHFLHIAGAVFNLPGDIHLWDEKDRFFYDVLHLDDGKKIPMKVRSIVGLIPLFAVETIDPELLEDVPEFKQCLESYLERRPDLADLISHWDVEGRGERRLLSLLRGSRMKALFRRMLDETEFLSDFGIRALSKVHKENPYTFYTDGDPHTVTYVPAESENGMFGGNSNWRGPIWFPVNYLLIESMQKFHHYYGDEFKVECPVGSGNYLTILEASEEISRRLVSIFTKDETGKRAVFKQYPRMQDDPNFRDNILFYEYFHGDNGRGVGASHQTGWTALVAKLIQPRRKELKGQFPRPRCVT